MDCQDWLYEDGEDATKAVYISKMDDIRFVAGPIVARYQDKIEEERQAVLKVEEEKLAKKRAEVEAKKKAEEDAKKAAEPKKDKDSKGTNGANPVDLTEDTDMKDADVVQPDGVEEPAEGGK